MAHDLELTLMLADYHRTRPLLNGEVTAARNQAAAAPRRDRRSVHAAGV